MFLLKSSPSVVVFTVINRLLFRSSPFYCIVLTMFALFNANLVCGQNSANQCDWLGSGLNQDEDSRGIQPIYLRCTQGKIQWKYPRGGLRVILRHGMSGKDFKGCIRVHKSFSGAQIFVEGHRTLYPLYSGSDKKHKDLHRCFVSHRGQIALYVESEPIKDTLNKNIAEFSYDLQARSRKTLVDDSEDCRPCTDEELLLYYCISDFVVRGIVTDVFNNRELDRTELRIKTSKVVRETYPVLDADFTSNEIRSGGVDGRLRDDNVRPGTFHLPLKCDAHNGGDDDEFLFLGRIVLGNPVVQCAPRIEHWKRVRQQALNDYKNQCKLD